MRHFSRYGRLELCLIGYALVVTGLSVVNLILPERNGPLALSQIVAPHLVLPLVLALPLVARRRWGPLAIVVGAALAVALVRFGPGMLSLPPAGVREAEVVRLLSWNLETGLPTTPDVLAVLATTDADIVALQELAPPHAAAIEGDATIIARFPYRALFPVTGAAGVGVLSRFPLDAIARGSNPFLVQAALRLPGGQVVTVIDAHPFPARITTVTDFRVPVWFDPTERDAAIRVLRSRVDEVLARHGPLALIGDFNVTDREPGYNDLAAGLLDAHREVGQGTGSTWRPDRMKFLPFGVLRIDYLFTGGGIAPTEISEDCTPRGTDHCVVRAMIAVPAEAAP